MRALAPLGHGPTGCGQARSAEMQDATLWRRGNR